jgi:hypothetical protein
VGGWVGGWVGLGALSFGSLSAPSLFPPHLGVPVSHARYYIVPASFDLWSTIAAAHSTLHVVHFTSYFKSNVTVMMNRYGFGRPFLDDVAARIEHCA